MDFKHAFTRDQLEDLQGVGSANYFNLKFIHQGGTGLPYVLMIVPYLLKQLGKKNDDLGTATSMRGVLSVDCEKKKRQAVSI